MGSVSEYLGKEMERRKRRRVGGWVGVVEKRGVWGLVSIWGRLEEKEEEKEEREERCWRVGWERCTGCVLGCLRVWWAVESDKDNIAMSYEREEETATFN